MFLTGAGLQIAVDLHHRGKPEPVPQFFLLLRRDLVLRADDRSLTGEEADEDVKSILETLEKELGAVLR